MKINSTLLLVVIVLSGLPIAHAQDTKSSVKETLEHIRRDARKDIAATAQALRAMEAATMNEGDRATWVRLSRVAALRLGDRDWLLSLKGKEDPFSEVPLAYVLLASGHIEEGDFAAAHKALAQIKNLDRINTRDQRRYWALKARMGQLEGNIAAEREAVEHIVAELGHWTSENCQSCHEDLKSPGAIPMLDIQDFWVAKRFVALMQKQGDAENVKQVAEKRLANDPADEGARIRLGYALLALGRTEEATEKFREISWAVFPDRKGPAPRMIFVWP
jgi:tetratricopeptide (TPR) repeat protein